MTAARLAAACVVLAALAGATPRARAAGNVLTVTVATDSDASAAPGSLRFVIENEAISGDTIRFASPFVIPIDGVLQIPQDIDGLRIEGPVELRGGKVDAIVDGLVVTDVRFTGCEVLVGSRLSAAPTVDPIFRGDTFVTGGTLNLLNTRDATVEDCTFDMAPRTTVYEAFSEGSRWIHNTFQGRGKPLFQADDGSDFVMERNTVRGAAFLTPRSGRIEDNDVEGLLMVTRPDFEATGDLLIRNNRIAHLRATRANLDVDGNTITGAKRGSGETIACSLAIAQAIGDTGFIRVRNNTVDASGGWRTGMYVFATDAAPEVLVENNTVTGAKSTGLTVDTGSACKVEGNVLQDCGGGASAALALRGAGSMDVNGVKVNGGRGLGVVVLPGAGALRMTGTDVNGCKKAAVSLTGRTFSFVGNVLDACGGGIFVGKNTKGDIEGDTLRDHRGPGIFISPGAQVRIRDVSMSGSSGAGIDLSPPGVTTNKRKRQGNRGIPYPEELAFDNAKRSVTGRALPGAAIQVYRVEDGPRAGNPKNGEGERVVANGVAGGDGTFSIPVACKNGDKVTLTATSAGADPVTSEFSENVACGESAEIELVSQATAGAEGDGQSTTAGGVMLRNVSGDGRYVVFQSQARNLDDPGVPGTFVYLRDTQEGTTVRVTRTHDGGEFDTFAVNGAYGQQPSISDDGRFVVYQTNSRNVLPGEANSDLDIALYDVTTSQTIAVTDPTLHEPRLPSGRGTHLGAIDPEISGDGSTVVFSSYDRDWVPGDAGDDADFFVWTRATGAYERVSVPTGGGDIDNGTYGTFGASISHDGRFVAFTTNQQLVAGKSGIFVRDRTEGTTVHVATSGGGARVSDDGRFVVFTAYVSLLPEDTNGSNSDVYLWDRQSPDALQLISRDEDGDVRFTYSILPFLSGDGRFVAYQVSSSQVYLYDRVPGTTTFLYQVNSRSPSLSRDGSLLTFQSEATNLVPGRTVPAFRPQVYLRRLPPPAD